MRTSLSVLQTALANAVMTADVSADRQFDGVSTDSRNIAAGNLFVALRGEHFDAHDFLHQVAEKGVAAVVVEQVPAGLQIPALVVPDTRIALGQIAAYWRQQFSIPVIGVTGSNGKTTVKEMISSILMEAYGKERFLATRGNLNNDIGVPLTIMRMNANQRAAVVELGMNHPGEIALLSHMAQPTVGLVNNAQREHQEFMASVEAVAEENGAVIKSLPADGIAVFPADEPYTALWEEYARPRKVLTFGLSPIADVTCSCQPNDFGSELMVTAGPRQFPIRLAVAGVHNVRNALAAVACAIAIGINVEAIQIGLESFSPVNGRLQRKTARNGALVIDDTYNANPDSVRAAIDVLAYAAQPRFLVLGDMGEVGNEGRKFHEEIGVYASENGIENLFTLGDLARYASDVFGENARHFTDIGLMNQTLEQVLPVDATVLIKGSRFMKMERAVQHLLGQSGLQETH